jgi:hypothetical protein
VIRENRNRECGLILFLLLARFDEAKDILVEFERRVEGLAMITLRRIGLERRRAIHEASRVKPDPDGVSFYSYDFICLFVRSPPFAQFK